MAAVAADVGIDLSIAECENVYDDRSALVHGFGLDLKECWPARVTVREMVEKII